MNSRFSFGILRPQRLSFGKMEFYTNNLPILICGMDSVRKILNIFLLLSQESYKFSLILVLKPSPIFDQQVVSVKLHLDNLDNKLFGAVLRICTIFVRIRPFRSFGSVLWIRNTYMTHRWVQITIHTGPYS
jgi:hypothetical protein